MRRDDRLPEAEYRRMKAASNGHAEPVGLQGRVRLGDLLRGGIEPTPQLLDGLLYQGRIHSISSGPGTGKTMLAEWMAIQVMRQGHRVLYMDAENGPKLIAERLGELGANLDDLDETFFYYPADLSLDAESLARLEATVEEVKPALVVFDSFADFLALAGLEENSNSDCTLWMTRVAQPLKDAGVALLLLDHVPKSGSGGPRGAGSKVAKVDVAWSLEVTLGFDRERTGQITLKHTKDREAWLPRMVQFSIGGGVFARSEGTVEQREGDGLTNSQRTALEALNPHPEGLTFSEWKGACCPSEMSPTSFNNARRYLLDAGLVRNERQRWYASGSSTPSSTLGSGRVSETGTPGQVHLPNAEGEKPLQNSGTPGQSVPDVYFHEPANNGGTPTYTSHIWDVGVPMADVPGDVPLSVPEIAEEIGRANRGPSKALASWLADPNPTRLEYLTRSVLTARDLDPGAWEHHAGAVKLAAADPDNHPLGCSCGGCL
ncbi:MAG: AAA family ATPase [Actinomycetota bacterium]|nr:AAA family ATPase [Actinomycetota bacterium]